MRWHTPRTIGLVIVLVGAGRVASDTAARELAVEPVHVSVGQDSYALYRDVEYALDADGASTLADVDGLDFRPVRDPSMTFGFANEAYWFRGQVRNIDHPNDRWIFLIDYTLLDRVDFHWIGEHGPPQHVAGGDMRPFARRSHPQRHFNFEVHLPPGSGGQFYLRVATESSMQVPLHLLSPTALADRSYRGQFGLGLLYGVLVALLFYNLILFLSTRDTTFLYYVLYVAAFILAQLHLNGLAFEYLWPTQPGLANTAVPVSIALGLMAMSQFCRSFLDLRNTLPRLDRIFVLAIVWFAALAVGAFFFSYRSVIIAETASTFAEVALIFVAAVLAVLRGYRPARYFLIAWFVLLLGIATFAAVSFGLLPKTFITEYGIQVGSAAEMVLLSFALAYRLNLLKEENARIAREARELLEQRVAVRTRELNETLVELARANARLEESSLRDGLTGAFNRRFLDRALAEYCENAAERRTPLVVIILDLDDFKELNDARGHLAGDDSLRAVSAVIEDLIKPQTAVLCRYGGEEFVILAIGLERSAAVELAESARRRIEALEVRSDDQRFSVTASFGVRVAVPEADVECRDFLRDADQALYRAKEAGRNRVAVFDR